MHTLFANSNSVIHNIVAENYNSRTYKHNFVASLSEHECPPDGGESKINEDVGEEIICSPIRVSPDRDRDRSRRSRESGSKVPIDGKLSVKERLYVSRQMIGL